MCGELVDFISDWLGVCSNIPRWPQPHGMWGPGYCQDSQKIHLVNCQRAQGIMGSLPPFWDIASIRGHSTAAAELTLNYSCGSRNTCAARASTSFTMGTQVGPLLLRGPRGHWTQQGTQWTGCFPFSTSCTWSITDLWIWCLMWKMKGKGPLKKGSCKTFEPIPRLLCPSSKGSPLLTMAYQT